MKKHPEAYGPNEARDRPTVSFRIPRELRDFYAKKAEVERRSLTNILQIALEDHAAELANHENVAA